jgi:Glycosyl transferases group 1
MRERLKTLVLDADGGGLWRYVGLDTVLRGILRSRADASVLPAPLRDTYWARELLGPRYGILSYALDWREALCAAPQLDVEVCNVNNLIEYRRRRASIRQLPLIVILHSAAGDRMGLLQRTAHWFEGRKGKLVVFLGNEYDRMDEKLAYLRSVGADYVCSQLPIASARWVYTECAPTRVLSMPHALNPGVYAPDPSAPRTIDIGFCGDVYPPFIGDTERTAIIACVQRQGPELGLKVDFRLNARMQRADWADFLRRCRGTVGAESGSYYLDRQGRLLLEAKAYCRRHPRAPFEEVFERFFRAPRLPFVSGKSISSRHFEPIGTKTCQLLLEGHYNGILEPGEHYIPIKTDLSNVQEALRLFRDDGVRDRIVERTYQYAMDQHTYQHRVQTLVRTVCEDGAAPAAGSDRS